MTLQYAFKEWASICAALASGRQAIILRKGGIADPNGLFVPEHTRFWLYPTFVHQQAAGIKANESEFLAQAESHRPPEGIIRFTHFAEITGAYHVEQEFAALLLDALHIWSESTVRARFAYRRPGLYVLPARVYAVPQPFEVPHRPEFDGCKTWVELDRGLSTDGATPVLSDDAFEWVRTQLDLWLNPTANV